MEIPSIGWALKNNQEMFSLLTKLRNQLIILSYGTDLDNHQAIQHLIEKYLILEVQEQNAKIMEVKYDTYDSYITKEIKVGYLIAAGYPFFDLFLLSNFFRLVRNRSPTIRYSNVVITPAVGETRNSFPGAILI